MPREGDVGGPGGTWGLWGTAGAWRGQEWSWCLCTQTFVVASAENENTSSLFYILFSFCAWGASVFTFLSSLEH